MPKVTTICLCSMRFRNVVNILLSGTCNKSSRAISRDVVPKPLEQYQDSIFETGQIHNVNKEPRPVMFLHRAG